MSKKQKKIIELPQREIKFRAWDKKEKKMYYVKNSDDGYLDYFPLRSLLEHNCPFIWMQYTGLKDKNGKEIYEGDIVRFYQCRDKKGGVWLSLYKDYREWFGEIIFKEGRFEIGNTKYIGKSNIEEKKVDSWEIIGNIYENPELLTT